jgi:membrane associated rhomboid family serine protease
LQRNNFYELYPVTALLLLLIVGFFALEQVAQHKLSEEFDTPRFVWGLPPTVTEALGALRVSKVRDGEVWRLLSSVFLHDGVLHLLLNASGLVFLGRLCEPKLSSAKFFTVFLLSGLGGSALSFGIHHRQEYYSAVGASGALMGLLGVLLTHSLRERDHALRDLTLRLLGGMVVLSLALSASLDHAGHVGGLLTGAVLGLTVGEYTTSRHAARWRLPAYVGALVLTASLGFAVWNYFSQLAGK